MRKYAVLKNVARGINFGVVVKSDIDQRFYGWSDKGIEWADWANQNGGRLENLPIGVSVGEFKSLPDELLQKIIANSDDIVAVDQGVNRESVRHILVKSERFNNSSKFPSVTTKSIPIAVWDKKISVQYKVKHFKQSIARSEISLKVRHNELAFNVQSRQFNTKPSRASRLTERHDIRAKMSRGSERIFGGQIVDAINKEILSSESMTLTKRSNVGSHTKEVVDFFVKGKLGYTIGRAGRGGLRSMTPNRGERGSLRGSASRVIAGVLDPRTRRDVDGDGMIFDGTWREMPDPTKFKPEARNTRMGGLRSTRNEIAKTRIVGKPARARVDLLDAFDAVQRVNDGDDFNSTFGDLWKAVKGPNDWGDLLTDVAAKLSTEKPNLNGKDEKEVAKSIKNIVDSSSSGLSKSKGHRYESSSLGSLTDYVSRVATGRDADATDVIASFDDPYAPKGSKANALEAMVAFGLGKLETPQSRKKYEDSRGFKSRTGSVIDDILYASEGAAEPEMDDLLRKVKMGETLKQSESRSLLDSLKDIKNNNDEFLGDERLENLINHVSEMSSIDTDSGGRELLSPTSGKPKKKTRGLSSSTFESVKEMAEGANEDDFISMYKRFIDGETLNPADKSELAMSIRNILDNNPDINEDERAELIDLLGNIKKGERSGGMSSRSTRRPVEQNLTSRMATASTERASRPRGLSSSTDTSTTKTPVSKDGAKKSKRKSRLIIDITDSFGKKKGEGDGVLWESLTDEQKAQAKEALAERKEMIAKQLKTKIFKRWWQKATEEGSDKESLRAVRQRARGTGGKYAVRPADDPLTKDDIVDLLVTMDEQVSRGLLKQYKVDEKTNQIVLDKNGKPVMTETYANAARYLDDMMTILNMEEEDDFSLLEHLHTGSRQALHRKIGSAITGKFKMGDSSIAGFTGGLQKATSVDELSDAELGKAKKLSIGKRLLRVNEARAAKARQRALRKTGSFRKGRILQSGDPELEMKRARLRARASRRSMLSKFRRTRDADELSSDMSKVKSETSLIAIDNDGVVSISPRYVATLAKLDADLSRDRSSEENKSRVYDQLLADLWANSGFSGQPTLVTEDETRRLVAAGWQPVIRGTGSEEVNSESYVEQFLTDDSESRFIPGQGARAYGVGEYFAFPGSNWSGYRGSANQRHTILVLIPPSADIISSRELSKEKSKMQELTSASVDALKTLGGREIAEGLTPGELAKTLRDAMPSLPQEKSRSAQIMSQLVDRLDELEGIPASTESLQEKKNILNSIDYLFRFTKQKDDGYFAPLIGVDAIDVNDGSGTASPLLLHNRAGVAAFQRPMTSEEAERLSKNEQGSSIGNVISTWATMGDRRRVVSATPSSAGSRSNVGKKRRPSTRRPDSDGPTETADPTPAVQAPSAPKSAVNTDTWTSSNPPSTGSNPATMLTDPNGTKYYAKLPKRGEPISTATERMETEVLAGKLYELAGVPVADLQMGTNNGEPVMLSRMIQTRMPSGKADNDRARDGFVVDAWLANWDAPLNDNIKVDNNGRPVRLDVGGSLDYRAQGAKKGSGGSTGFGPNVGEMTSMQKSGASADFTNMDAGELKKQTQKLGTVTDDQIRKTVSAIVSDPARAKILADTLIARRDDIIKRYG